MSEYRAQQHHIIEQLLDKLWNIYLTRVEHARAYADMILDQGGEVHNDHIALRTFNTKTGEQPAGAQGLARIFTALGYEAKTQYDFPTKKLTAWHYEHEELELPKVFISQLEVEKLPEETQQSISEAVGNTHDPLTAAARADLETLRDGNTIEEDRIEDLISELTNAFVRPWEPPKKSIINPVNDVSQYAAWTLLHGNSINHFTAFINKQDVASLPDLEATVNALLDANVPMKDHIEGEPGSKLRQSSTQAVDAFCDVTDENGKTMQMNWSYAYYELAERGTIKDENGDDVEFTGFLGEQATNLFEMTRRHG